MQTTPKARKADIQVLDDQELAALFRHLEGRPLYMPVLLAASTGMRRGEVLAVRWSDIDLDRAELQVARVAELVAGEGLDQRAKDTAESAHNHLA